MSNKCQQVFIYVWRHSQLASSVQIVNRKIEENLVVNLSYKESNGVNVVLFDLHTCKKTHISLEDHIYGKMKISNFLWGERPLGSSFQLQSSRCQESYGRLITSFQDFSVHYCKGLFFPQFNFVGNLILITNRQEGTMKLAVLKYVK